MSKVYITRGDGKLAAGDVALHQHVAVAVLPGAVGERVLIVVHDNDDADDVVRNGNASARRRGGSSSS